MKMKLPLFRNKGYGLIVKFAKEVLPTFKVADGTTKLTQTEVGSCEKSDDHKLKKVVLRRETL